MNSLRDWLSSTPRRTFVLYPILVVLYEVLTRGTAMHFVTLGIPLMVWGYLQYKLVGAYRGPRGGGGPGMHSPPDRIVDTGPYAYVRNPMYLGHLIFLAGLALTFWSVLGFVILVATGAWFHYRVLGDEVELEAKFGEAYRDYTGRVRRWLPGLL